MENINRITFKVENRSLNILQMCNGTAIMVTSYFIIQIVTSIIKNEHNYNASIVLID